MSDPDYVESEEEYSSSDDSCSEDETDETPFRHSYYVEDAKSIIVRHMDITNANALAINQKMQENMQLLKGHLEEMLRKCRQRYKHNEEVLLRKAQPRSDKHHFTKRNDSFYFYGYPFFKNHELVTARPNADYLYRKNSLGEHFPIEVDETPLFWVIMDKVCLINAVRDQVINWSLRKFKIRKRPAQAETEPAADSDLSLTVGEYKSKLLKMRLVDLMDMISDQDQFAIDWQEISHINLDGRHKPNAAEAIWNAYLRPSLNRHQWTPEEDDLLLNVIANCKPLDWSEVAKRMNRRSFYQCLVHYRTKLAVSSTVNCGRWTKEEDALLLRMVAKYRIGNEIPWSNVVMHIPTRNKNQIYQRYTMTLKPDINHERFTTEEDCKLMAAFKELGANFHLYSSILPGRTTVQIRNRYANVLRFVGKRSHWTQEDDTILMEHVAKVGTSNWSAVAARLERHTRTSCRSRYMAITKHMAKNPNCELISVPRRRAKFSCEVTSDNWVEKIIEAKQAPLTHKPKPSMALSNINRAYYRYFKYSFRYAFSDSPQKPTPTTDKTIAICRALQCKMCPVDNRLLTALPTATIDLNYLEDADADAATTFAVDQNTAQLLRGISIMFPDDLTDADRIDVNTSVSHPALDLFRRRFATLLTNPALHAMFQQNKSAIKPSAKSQPSVVTIEMDSRLAEPPKVYCRKKRKTLNESVSVINEPDLSMGTPPKMPKVQSSVDQIMKPASIDLPAEAPSNNDDIIVNIDLDSQLDDPFKWSNLQSAPKILKVTNTALHAKFQQNKSAIKPSAKSQPSVVTIEMDSRLAEPPKVSCRKKRKSLNESISVTNEPNLSMGTPPKMPKVESSGDQKTKPASIDHPAEAPTKNDDIIVKIDLDSQLEDPLKWSNLQTAPKSLKVYSRQKTITPNTTQSSAATSPGKMQRMTRQSGNLVKNLVISSVESLNKDFIETTSTADCVTKSSEVSTLHNVSSVTDPKSTESLNILKVYGRRKRKN